YGLRIKSVDWSIAKFYSAITFRHSAADFWEVYRASRSAVERRRAQFFALLAEGRSESEVLSITKYAVTSARDAVERYHCLGLAGLQDGRQENVGAPRVLTDDEQQELAARLQADFDQGQVWDGPQLQRWIKEQFGKDVYLSRTYEFMRAAGFSPQQPRPQHVGGDDAAKEAFKTKF
ncbi:winged helix-turn-helix domain-containing protein, partial [Deinococcus sp. SM5_A1]|uniref:winged helix-turn-helix domain-containing protein n=1 Tax=Deinococcus sp. SM5_A1 TaxID=3379094 RepID=UPI0038582D66